MKNHNLILLGVVCLSVAVVGCSKIKYTSKNGESVTYSRIGANTIQGLEVSKNADGVTKVKIDKTTTDAGQMGEAMASFAQSYAGASK